MGVFLRVCKLLKTGGLRGALNAILAGSSNTKERDIGNDTAKCTVCQLVIRNSNAKYRDLAWSGLKMGTAYRAAAVW